MDGQLGSWAVGQCWMMTVLDIIISLEGGMIIWAAGDQQAEVHSLEGASDAKAWAASPRKLARCCQNWLLSTPATTSASTPNSRNDASTADDRYLSPPAVHHHSSRTLATPRLGLRPIPRRRSNTPYPLPPHSQGAPITPILRPHRQRLPLRILPTFPSSPPRGITDCCCRALECSPPPALPSAHHLRPTEYRKPSQNVTASLGLATSIKR
jgi:hypothetical protein